MTITVMSYFLMFGLVLTGSSIIVILMDQHDNETPVGSQDDKEDKTQPADSETKEEPEKQDKSKEDHAELMRKVAEKLSEVNELLLQVADKDKN